MFIPYYGTFSKFLHLRYIDTVFKKAERVIRICIKLQNLFKDLF